MSLNLMTRDAHILRLERELQRTRIIAICGVLLGAVVALSGFQGRADEVVRAERVELVNGEGLRQAILGADSLGFFVTLLDDRERPTGSLRLSDEPRLAVATGRGREVAGLGAPKVHKLGE